MQPLARSTGGGVVEVGLVFFVAMPGLSQLGKRPGVDGYGQLLLTTALVVRQYVVVWGHASVASVAGSGCLGLKSVWVPHIKRVDLLTKSLTDRVRSKEGCYAVLVCAAESQAAKLSGQGSQ